LTPAARAEPWYVFQTMFHGSTAPGFLFASGFVAGLPRAPLSLRAGLRRARRLLLVLGVGYFLRLPYASPWETLAPASPAARAAPWAAGSCCSAWGSRSPPCSRGAWASGASRPPTR